MAGLLAAAPAATPAGDAAKRSESGVPPEVIEEISKRSDMHFAGLASKLDCQMIKQGRGKEFRDAKLRQIFGNWDLFVLMPG